MKNITIYICCIAAAFVFGACNLDQGLYSEYPNDGYAKSAADVDQFVLATYNGLHGVMYYEWAVTELRSDNARMRVNNSKSAETKLVEQLDQGTIGTAHAWVRDYWEQSYRVIRLANKVLNNLDVVDDADLRAQYEAEAKFLRAHIYFNIVRLWGPVFIVTKELGNEDRYMQRSSTSDVYTLIETDLEAIIDNQMLPEVMTGSNIGRADLRAAKALLAKVYMTNYEPGIGKYMLAGDLLRDMLVQAGDPLSGADLVPYDRIFAIDNEMNKEIIFTVRYKSGNVALGSPFGTLFGPNNNGNNVILGSPKHYNYPSDNVLAAYKNSGTDENPDLRKNVNIKETYYNSTTKKWITKVDIARWCDKYLYKVKAEYDGENDWPVIRVGDVALLLSEWANEMAGPTDEAFTYLNMVRERAGLEPYQTTDLASKFDFRMAVRQERRLELAYENQHWFDLLRWGTAVQTVNDYIDSENFYGGYSYTVTHIEQWQTMLPIPMSITVINPRVAQNPGY